MIIATNIPADRLVDTFVAGAAGVLAVSEGGPAGGGVGTAASATGVLAGSAGAAAAAGVSAGVSADFLGRADGRVR
jgi:hypothetical protein